MRQLILCLLIPIFLFAGKINAQTITQGYVSFNAFAPVGNDAKMAPPGNSTATVRVYPNPVADYLTISMPYQNTKPMTVCLYDASGKLAQRNVMEPGASEYYIDVRANANGTYFVKVAMHDVQVVRKVVLLTK